MGVLWSAAIVTFGVQVTGFVVAVLFQTEGFYDIVGGFNFLLLAWLGIRYKNENENEIESLTSSSSSSSSTSSSPTVLLQYMTLLFVASRGWLLLFLAWRAYHRKGDSRFDNVKNNPPLFFVYWMVQACWVYFISMPLLVIQEQSSVIATATTNASTSSTPLTTVQILLLLGFAFSILMEVMSDIQKTLWIQRGREGGFCTDGWWSLSRHPNYAAEIMQWWFAAALAITGYYYEYDDSSTTTSFLFLPWMSLVSPLFTMHILLNLSGTGVWNAEGKNLKRYYEGEKGIRERYIQYRKTTPPVFPIPLLLYGSIPMSMKRLLCFEWERYEYNEKCN